MRGARFSDSAEGKTDMHRQLSMRCGAVKRRCTSFLSYVVNLCGGRRNVMRGFNEGVALILIAYTAVCVGVAVVLAIN